jgi:hypothetical protein
MQQTSTRTRICIHDDARRDGALAEESVLMPDYTSGEPIAVYAGLPPDEYALEGAFDCGKIHKRRLATIIKHSPKSARRLDVP